MNFPNKKYSIIYADPAWQYDDKALSGNRGACCKYDVMENEDIKNLSVNKISDKNCILFLWATFPKIIEALDVLKAWGFEYKTVGFTWIKHTKNTSKYFMGMGRWTRSNAEIILIGVKGKPKRINAGISQIINTPIREHSRKPDIVRDKIVQLCGDLPRIELFARTKVHGWDVWGNDPKLESKPLENFV